MSCPYIPKKNRCVEHKLFHLTEIGLAMLFGANHLATLWIDAFSSTTISKRLLIKILDGKTPFELMFHSTLTYNDFK